MKFQPYHYDHVNDFLRYYASTLNHADIIRILNNGIMSEEDANLFCKFIPLVLDQRLLDEEAGKATPVEIGSSIIHDLHYEAGSFVCDAGYESVWDAMIDQL